MADKNIIKSKKAARRRQRVRKKIVGTSQRPRLAVTKSLKNVFAQIIDDSSQVTLAAAASNSKAVAGELKDDMTKTQAAFQVGLALARIAKEKGIETVVFDRNISRYHGRVKALAEGARKGGLKF